MEQLMAAKKQVSELDAHLGYWLRFVSSHVSHAFRLKVEAQGVTVSEWVVLRETYRLGVTSPSALVQVLGLLAARNDEEFFGHMPPPLRAEIRQAMQDIVRVHQLKSVPMD